MAFHVLCVNAVFTKYERKHRLAHIHPGGHFLGSNMLGLGASPSFLLRKGECFIFAKSSGSFGTPVYPPRATPGSLITPRIGDQVRLVAAPKVCRPSASGEIDKPAKSRITFGNLLHITVPGSAVVASQTAERNCLVKTSN